MENKLSVSLCVYNGDDENYFDKSLESICNQTKKPDEIVITIDGPIPQNLEKIIKKYRNKCKKEKITYKTIRIKENKGHGEARRMGLNNCKNDIIAIMDADDLCVNTRFEKQLEFLSNHPDVSVVGGYIDEFQTTKCPSDTSKIIGRRIVPDTDAAIKTELKKRCPMNQVTVMFRKKDVESVGGYLDWFCEEDYYLWARMMLAGKKMGNIKENLVYVRMSENSYRRRGGIKYFRSEKKFQKYLLDNKIINVPRYLTNVCKRFVVQIAVPNRLRYVIFKKLARKKVQKGTVNGEE